MGVAASVLHSREAARSVPTINGESNSQSLALEAQREREHRLREEMTLLFVNEFHRLSKQNLTEEELKSEFSQSLITKEREIVSRFASEVASKEQEEETKGSEQHPRLRRFVDNHTASFKRLVTKGAHTFLVCVDGSSKADNAFKTATHLRRKADNIVLFHTYSPATQQHKSPGFKAGEIRLRYESQLIGALPIQNYFISFIEKVDGASAKEVITEMVDDVKKAILPANVDPYLNHHRPDFLVMGYSGRRMELEGNKSIMGSTIDLALRQIHIPVIIAKSVCPAEARSYVFAVDQSETSRRGLDILLTLLCPKDKLLVVHISHVSTSSVSDEIQDGLEPTTDYYNTELALRAPIDSRFICIPDQSGVTLIERLTSYVNDEIAPDFLVIAPRAQTTITSITEQVILLSKCSVILCKS